MRILSKISLLAASVVMISMSGMAFVAAETGTGSNDTPTSSPTATPTPENSDGATTGKSKKDKVADKLAETHDGSKLNAAKLKVCQKRETNINNIMSRIADRGQKQLDLFTSIATKTETFYTSKGKTLSNYDALVADVTAKQAAAQTTVDTIKSTSVTFKCDGTDPKGAAASFKDALKSEIAALKDFRTAVKNLIVGVKSAEGTTGGTQ